jgi:hypothetical protein
MPNVTISVPEALKSEMDTLSEVSWSKICREAISRYITQRNIPTPNIELDLEHARLQMQYHQSGYPVLSITLRIHNKMEFEITIDILQLNVAFMKENSASYVGLRYDLFKNIILPTSTISKQTFIQIPKEKIEDLQNEFDSTFGCKIECLVFIDGFKQPYRRELWTRIPIDEWKKLVLRRTGKIT